MHTLSLLWQALPHTLVLTCMLPYSLSFTPAATALLQVVYKIPSPGPSHSLTPIAGGQLPHTFSHTHATTVCCRWCMRSSHASSHIYATSTPLSHLLQVVYEIPSPGPVARLEILRYHSRNKRLQGDDPSLLTRVAEVTQVG